MKPRTEELLYLLLWSCENVARPTWRNLTESFEGWAYRKGLLRQLQRLEQKDLLEHQSSHVGDRLHRLTQMGRLRALGGRDPDARWRRPWDGHWHLVLFDVPESRSSARDKLRRYLRSRGFGYLQNSVWIAPDLDTEERAILAKGPVDVEALLLLEARPGAGETNAEIVAGAWDFTDINKQYAKHQEILNRRPRGRLSSEAAAKQFYSWLQKERAHWIEVISRDPFLPEALLPSDYAGCRTWRNRVAAMAEAGEQMRTFQPQIDARQKMS